MAIFWFIKLMIIWLLLFRSCDQCGSQPVTSQGQHTLFVLLFLGTGTSCQRNRFQQQMTSYWMYFRASSNLFPGKFLCGIMNGSLSSVLCEVYGCDCACPL